MSAVRTLDQLVHKANPDKDPKLIQKKSPLSLIEPWSIGIEFELENLTGPKQFRRELLDRGAWTDVHDGSLRGESREFITRVPIKGDAAVAALENIYEAAGGAMEPFSSLRTSAHVHVNVLDMTTAQLAIYSMAGAMAEPAILAMVDEYRKFCGYCINSLPAAARMVYAHMRGRAPVTGLTSRYYGVNVLSVEKHGTLEFRHFSVPNTIEEAVRNINLCLMLKRLSIDIAEAQKELSNKKSVEDAVNRLYATLTDRMDRTKIVTPDVMMNELTLQWGANERWSKPGGGAVEQGQEEDQAEPATEPLMMNRTEGHVAGGARIDWGAFARDAFRETVQRAQTAPPTFAEAVEMLERHRETAEQAPAIENEDQAYNALVTRITARTRAGQADYLVTVANAANRLATIDLRRAGRVVTFTIHSVDLRIFRMIINENNEQRSRFVSLRSLVDPVTGLATEARVSRIINNN